MSCGRGTYWDVKEGHLVMLNTTHFHSTYALAIHVHKRANRGYPDAVAAMLECTEDPILQIVVERSRLELLPRGE